MKIVKIAQSIPEEYRITPQTPFMFHSTLEDTSSISSRTGRPANKQYVYRVYSYPNNRHQYAIITFSGPIRGTLRTHFKGNFNNLNMAIRTAERMAMDRVHEHRSNYVQVLGDIHRTDIPGQFVGSQDVGREFPDEQEDSVDSMPSDTQDAVQIDTVDVLKEYQDLFAENKFDEMLSDEKYWELIIGTYSSVDTLQPRYTETLEDFIPFLLTDQYKDKFLSSLPESNFDKLRMTSVNRKIIEEYYNPVSNSNEENMLGRLFGKNNSQYKKAISDVIEERWYSKASDKVVEQLKGYFKYSIESDYNERGFYTIWWKGLGGTLEITESDLPEDLFTEHYPKIKKAAQQEAAKVYMEVMDILGM